MKITKIDVIKVKPLMVNFTPVLCRIYTDEGIYGDGEAALMYGFAADAAVGMLKDLAKMLIGMNPLEHEVIWNKLYRTCFWGRNGGPIVFSGISALDIALWDIKGKAYRAPVYELLGGKFRSSLRSYASKLQNGWGVDRKPAAAPEDYAREAKKAVDLGFDCVKLNFFMFREDGSWFDKSGVDQTGYLIPARMKMLEARIAATREAIGPDVDLILENHCYTDAQSAVQMGNMAKKYGILYYEEPVTPNADLLSYVHKETGIPIASGERIYSRWQYKSCFDKESIQVIQPDLGTCGGFTEVKKICDMAFVHELGVQIHVCGTPLSTAAALHMECAIPNFVIHEYNVNCVMPDMLKLCAYDYQPVDGQFTIPDQPGIGNEFTDEVFCSSDIVTIQ